MYVLIGILLVGILIAVHEFGHFIAARISGIEVMEFAIGMGPKLIGWTGKKSGTRFSLRAIPLGGFCAFYGEDDVTGKAQDDPRAYNKQNVWKRLFTVAMGPLMNFVLAFVVAVCVYACMGLTVSTSSIDAVMAGLPAEQSGLMAGDVIVAVDGVRMETSNEISTALNVGGRALDVTVQRGDAEQTFSLTPVWVEDPEVNGGTPRYMIGISFAQETMRLPFGSAVAAGWDYCLEAGTMVFEALRGIFTDPAIRDQVVGPVGTIQVVSQAVAADGSMAFFSLLILISVNLGLMNLLPIPGLDGSRIVFHAIEAVRGKPVPQKVEATIHFIGFILLMALMLFFTYKDIVRIIFPGSN